MCAWIGYLVLEVSNNKSRVRFACALCTPIDLLFSDLIVVVS